MSDGLFISFEGVDGAGKTTQTQLAHDYLQERGLRSLVTREPGGTPAGLAIRELVLHGMASFPSLAVTGGSDVVDSTDDLAPRTEALLYAADRAEHVAQVVRPALDRGDIVLCDRYLDSSVAYQAGGRELSADVIRRLSLWATQDLLPTRTYLLDADPAQSEERLDHEPDRLESAGDDFQQNVRQEFLRLAREDPDRFLVIDASQPIDQVWQQIRKDLDALVQGRTPNLPEQDDDGDDQFSGQDASTPDRDEQDQSDDMIEDGYQDGDEGSDPDYAEEDDELANPEDNQVDEGDMSEGEQDVAGDKSEGKIGSRGGDDDDQPSSAATRSGRNLGVRLLRKFL